MKKHNIHIAFGFHINCYHSYRGDSNDNLGFGSDIRIIRHIIQKLNECNEEGIPVKATWDTENFFSLDQILPKYAPDIIEGIKERVEKYGDENIIMGYSNGALGAMNEEEFEASIEMAVTNDEGSGLKDIFGTCEKIVRPQEVMFTPSQVKMYNKCGVKALCLYYSCVPFDAFRTIVPKLDDEYAFNPLTYTYNGESMTIIPTYNNSDICDAGCLRSWVKELHQKQVNNEINRDLFIFVNMDADAIFWESMNLPLVKNRIANTDGINGLVREVADLDYVKFDTPAGYIKNHDNVGTIDFTQDTADGNFTGYASWSEKPYNRKIWTAIERSRAMSKAAVKSDFDCASFRDRVLLLSTTHFGLATPVLNIERERTANALATKIIEKEKSVQKLADKLTISNINGTTLQSVQLTNNTGATDASQIVLKSKDLVDYTVVPMDEKLKSVFAIMRFKTVKKQYTVDVEVVDKKPLGLAEIDLVAENLRIKFSVHGNIYSVLYKDKEIGDQDFLKSFITYDKEKIDFVKTDIKALSLGGSGVGVKVYGTISLPDQIEGGSFEYDFFKFNGSPLMFVKTSVKYPYTPETTSISTENSSLGRYSDMKWQEAVPFQITPNFNGDLRVLKRNFMGDVSSFRTQSFKECDPNNKSLASFNHQLSAGFVGLTDGEYGLAIANSRQVLNSMANCPMRLDDDTTVHMAPFGHFYGKQRHHWNRSNDKILDTYVLVTPQGKSIAPAYNGNGETAMLALSGFTGDIPDDSIMSEIVAFADGSVAYDNKEAKLTPFYGDNVVFKEAKADGIEESKLMNPVFSGIAGHIGEYVSKGARAISHIVKAQVKSKR